MTVFVPRAARVRRPARIVTISGGRVMPEWRHQVRSRLASLRLNPGREAEIVEELTQHLDERYEALRLTGVGEREAERVALEELCGPETLSRHMKPLRQSHAVVPIAPGTGRRALIADVFQDLRYAARMLRKHPGFAAAVVLTLALGVGANTAIFSLVNATLFQRMPVTKPEELVYVYRGTSGVFSYPGYVSVRDGNRVFDGYAAWGGIVASLNAGSAAEMIDGFIVTGNFFDVLGVRAARGRLITPEDDKTPGAHPVAVISHEFWQTRLAGDTGIVGRQVRLNGQPFTIIGVTPPGFPGPRLQAPRSLYVPMMMQAIMRPPRAGYSGEQNPDLLNHKTNSWLFGVGRLKPGVEVGQARAEIDAMVTSFFRNELSSPRPPVPAATLVRMNDGDANQRQQMISVALLLTGVVGAVLLIGCANIANLLLARAASRRREMAVRLAIGASRARIVRQLLVECVLLSLLGGAAGLGLAYAAIRAFQAAAPPPGALPGLAIAIDQRVLLFTFALSAIAGIVFGLAPALRASRDDVVPALKNAAGDGAVRRRFSVKQGLVVAEVALSLLLLIAAGLFVRSLGSAQRIDPGFDVSKLVSAPLNVNLLRYTTTQGRAFYRAVTERVEQLPGVESAALSRVSVLSGSGRILSVHVEGRNSTHEQTRAEGGGVVTADPTTINANVVGTRFFETLGIRLVLGRAFTEQDADQRPLVAIVNEASVKMHFDGENPLGKRVSFDGPRGPYREIVGVVRDSKYGTLREDRLPIAYLPLAQNHETGMTLYVRASVPPESLIAAVRREVQALEPNLPMPDLRTVADTVGISLYAPRMGAWLLSLFGGLAVLLAAVGVYGVLSFSTARRTHEMGLRLALGAKTRDVFLLVLRDGMLLVGVGIAAGLAGGLVSARFLSTFLYGVSTTDLPTFAATTAVLTMVAAVACAIPARRAMRVHPLIALRQE
jgi:predicted permease